MRVGRNGATPTSVSQFVDFGSDSRVNNGNAKFDVWLLPFLDVYGIAGKIWNESHTRIDVTLPLTFEVDQGPAEPWLPSSGCE